MSRTTEGLEKDKVLGAIRTTEPIKVNANIQNTKCKLTICFVGGMNTVCFVAVQILITAPEIRAAGPKWTWNFPKGMKVQIEDSE